MLVQSTWTFLFPTARIVSTKNLPSPQGEFVFLTGSIRSTFQLQDMLPPKLHNTFVKTIQEGRGYVHQVPVDDVAEPLSHVFAVEKELSMSLRQGTTSILE